MDAVVPSHRAHHCLSQDPKLGPIICALPQLIIDDVYLVTKTSPSYAGNTLAGYTSNVAKVVVGIFFRFASNRLYVDARP